MLLLTFAIFLSVVMWRTFMVGVAFSWACSDL